MTSRVPPNEFWAAAARTRFSPEGEMLTDEMMEEEFQAMYQALYQTSRRRNAMVSKIYRLPPEVLATIFRFTRDIWHPSTRPSPPQFYATRPNNPPMRLPPDAQMVCNNCINWDPGWIKLTQISHRFREIAFDTPSLWTKFDCSGLPGSWQKRVVSFSRSIPLSVSAYFNSGEMWDIAVYRNFDEALSASSVGRQRIRSLTLVQSSPSLNGIHQSLRRICDSPMPVLRELSLIAKPPRGHYQFEVPIHFWEQLQAPNLERLHISRCTLPNFRALHVNLTYFHALLLRYSTAGTLWAQIGPILRTMPRLEVLILSQDEEGILANGHSVVLPPTLHTLTLSGPGCASFTSELNIPDTVNLISISSTPFSPHAVQRLLYRHDGITPRSPIQASITRDDFILVDRWASRSDAGEYRAVHMYSSSCNWWKAMSMASQPLRVLDSVEDLTIKHHQPYSDQWRQLFAREHRVRTFDIDETLVPSFMGSAALLPFKDSISIAETNPGARRAPRIPFIGLERMQIVRVDADVRLNDAMLRPLLPFLRRRREAGHPLEQLIIPEGALSFKYLIRLSKEIDELLHETRDGRYFCLNILKQPAQRDKALSL